MTRSRGAAGQSTILVLAVLLVVAAVIHTDASQMSMLPGKPVGSLLNSVPKIVLFEVKWT